MSGFPLLARVTKSGDPVVEITFGILKTDGLETHEAGEGAETLGQ